MHLGLDANECALRNVFSITFGCLFMLFFQIHFFTVAKSWYLDLIDPLPDLHSESDVEMGGGRRRGQGRNGEELDWDPSMY